jgi:hypothetical protein
MTAKNGVTTFIHSHTFGRLTQRESAILTRWKSQVQILYRPPEISRVTVQDRDPFLFRRGNLPVAGLSGFPPEACPFGFCDSFIDSTKHHLIQRISRDGTLSLSGGDYKGAMVLVLGDGPESENKLRTF